MSIIGLCFLAVNVSYPTRQMAVACTGKRRARENGQLGCRVGLRRISTNLNSVELL